MFPYMFGNGGPIYWLPMTSEGGTDYGPHWSLIYEEVGDAYRYIEPNEPNTPVKYPKETVLKSNSFSDAYKYDRFWSKDGKMEDDGVTPLPYEYQSAIEPIGNMKTPAAKYDIGPKSRQTLANVLIAVF